MHYGSSAGMLTSVSLEVLSFVVVSDVESIVEYVLGAGVGIGVDRGCRSRCKSRSSAGVHCRSYW